MRRIYAPLLLLSFLSTALFSSFHTDFESKVQALGPGCHYGYLIEKNGQRYEHNADQFFIPASTIKLLTAIVALKELGPEHQFVTTLGKVANSRDYYLEFGGDTYFTSKELQELFAQLHTHRIDGDILWTDSSFSLPKTYEAWTIGDINVCEVTPIRKTVIDKNYLHYTVVPGERIGEPAEVMTRGLDLLEYELKNFTQTVPRGQGKRRKYFIDNEKVYIYGDIAVGSKPQKTEFPILDFEDYVEAQVEEAARKGGITLKGDVEQVEAVAACTAIATKRSRPLRESIREALRTSDNTYFSTLLAYMCEQKAPGVRRWKEAGAFLKDSIKRHYGVDLGGAALDDGCGLSRYQVITPRQLYSVLEAAYGDPEIAELLPEFKRGTLTGISTSAGRTHKGEIFVIFFNGFPGKSKPYLNLQKKVVGA